MKRHLPREKSRKDVRLRRDRPSPLKGWPPEAGPPERQALNIVQQPDHIFRAFRVLA